jgi:hypothetical protein
MAGAVGNDAASSAQSKRWGTGAERSSTGLRGGSTRDRGCETAVVGGSAAGVVDVTPFPRGCRRSSSGTFVGSETLRFRALWGWLGSIGSEHGLGGELGGSLGVDDVVGDVADVWDVRGGETTRLRSRWGNWGA